MKRKTRSAPGFTLVEMLVVITIIGILMSLLMPAVNSAVGTARSLYCKNNIRNLAIACRSFDASKGRLPGYREPVGENASSWIVATFPFLDKRDLYELWSDSSNNNSNNNSSAGNRVPYMDLYVCPSNPPEQTDGPINSYLINTGTTEEKPANGIAHNYAAKRIYTTVEYVTNGDGASYTLLVTESVKAANWDQNGKQETGFVWQASEPSGGAINAKSDEQNGHPSSKHTGGVNVAFCDTHVYFLREDIEYWVYQQLMTPLGKESDMPSADRIRVPSGDDYL